MSELTVPEQLFLHRWKSKDFTGWNEAEVREGFVIELLHTLGYRKGTTYDLELEKPLKLSHPFHRIGRQEVRIDYAPSVRKKYFWIVEAKPGKAKEIDIGDVLQVHLYAIHPEIQARLVMLTNGWEVRVYDALTLSSFDDALLVLNQNDDDSGFKELITMVGAPQMHRFQRKRMLDIIWGTLASEVDIDAFDELSQQLQRLVGEGRKMVEENGKELWSASMEERLTEKEKVLREATLGVLFVHMDNPGDRRPASAKEFVRRVIEASRDEQAKLVDHLAMRYRGRPHNVFRTQALQALVTLSKSGVELPKSAYVTSMTGCINELARSSINYRISRGMSASLCHLDNVACRVAAKLCIRVGTEHFSELLEIWTKSMTAEERIVLSPSLNSIVSSSANHLHEIFWRWFCSGRSDDEIWKGIWDLHAIEAELDKLPPRPEAGDLDSYDAQYIGLSWDPLRVATWNVLRDRPGLGSNADIHPTVLEFTSKSREEILANMPPELSAPEGYVPEKTTADALSALVIAIRTRTMSTVGQQIAGGLKH